MTLDQDLRRELSEAKGQAKERFEAQPAQLIGNGIAGGNALGASIDFFEFGEDVTDAYKAVFLQRGKDFTQGYLEGRKGLVRNLFSKEYKAAKRAFEEMQEPNYSKA
ncbi:MAG: hypothetical protein KKF67_03280 [Nanoarchaeota archaeon]|nr:hypothetical protein [Nanoarchaeota archaeon]